MDQKIFIKGYRYKPLKTKRLLLIKPNLKYKTNLYNLYQNKLLWKYNGSNENKTNLSKIEKQIITKIKNWKNKKCACFLIIFEDIFIGTISMYNVTADFGCCYIGYLLDPNYWNNGFMSEVLSEFIPFIFKNTRLFRISAQVCTKNLASIKVLEKSKFKREGLLKKSSIFNKKIYDNYIYSIIDNKKIKNTL